jgi:hypothetical protein
MGKLLLRLLENILERREVRGLLKLALRVFSPATWGVIGIAIVTLLVVWFLRRTRRGRRMAYLYHWLVGRPVHAIRRRL